VNYLDARLWLAMAAAVLIAYAGGRWEQHGIDKTDLALERAGAARDAARAQVKAVDDARIEEQRRVTAQTEVTNAARKEADAAWADARAADGAADRLRGRIAQLLIAARAAPKDSPAAGGSPATDDPIGMLADVLQRADRRAGILAEYADAARIAGQACERSYDSLTGVTEKPAERDRQ